MMVFRNIAKCRDEDEKVGKIVGRECIGMSVD